jgi:regulator of sirC expression with transglutaminase-like and TPR domain
LLTTILSFERQWQVGGDICQSMVAVNDIVDQCNQAMIDIMLNDSQTLGLDELNEVLDDFYLQQAFSSTTHQIPDSLLNSLFYLIHYHTGECLSMSVLLNHVLLQLGFKSAVKVIDHEIMLQVNISEDVYAIIDATSGEQFTHDILGQGQGVPLHMQTPNRTLDKASLEQVFLSQQKMAFTEEKQFDKALSSIELLIETAPDDPYQRRDRGFLLHQLDCFNLARDDFEFFIDQCPEDPAAQVLKMQLEDFDGIEHTVH